MIRIQRAFGVIAIVQLIAPTIPLCTILAEKLRLPVVDTFIPRTPVVYVGLSVVVALLLGAALVPAPVLVDVPPLTPLLFLLLLVLLSLALLFLLFVLSSCSILRSGGG